MPIRTLPTPPSRNDPDNFSSAADALLAALPGWTDDANALEQSLQLVATTGTSTTSLAIGPGSKSLTTQPGKAWAIGSYVYIVSAASVSNLMVAQVTAYDSGSGVMTVSVSSTGGSGTFSSWVIGLSAPDAPATNIGGGALGDIPYQSGPSSTSMLSAGAANRVLQANGASAPSWVSPESMVAGADAAGGNNFPRLSHVQALIAQETSDRQSMRQIAQIVTFQTGTVATGSTQIPADDTIPQQSEGDQYMSLSITPRNAASTLEIDVVFYSAITTTSGLITTAALFKDSGANAIAAGVHYGNGSSNYDGPIIIRHMVTAGSTSAQTFKIRAGVNTTGTLTFNGHLGAQFYGGVMASRMTIKEYLP